MIKQFFVGLAVWAVLSLPALFMIWIKESGHGDIALGALVVGAFLFFIMMLGGIFLEIFEKKPSYVETVQPAQYELDFGD